MLTKNQVKYIQSLGQKKFREAHQAFLVEGPKSVHEFLTNPRTKVIQVYATKTWVTDSAGAYPDVPILEIEEHELERISQLSTPNQVLLVAGMYDQGAQPQPVGRWTLALDTIQDPGNLGTILRIADWFGVSQVVCSEDCADWYNPKVVQSSMGSLGHLELFRLPLNTWLMDTKGVKVYAAMLEGKPIGEIKPASEGILLIGNESKGLEKQLADRANIKLTIPRIGQAESLNAAVATGILLSHLTGSGSL